MTEETRRGYIVDRLTWVLLGAGLAIAPGLDREELLAVVLLALIRLFFGGVELSDRRRWRRGTLKGGTDDR